MARYREHVISGEDKKDGGEQKKKKQKKQKKPFRIHGTVAPGFERVKEVFAAGFQKRIESSAQLCVYVEGECVVDLWGTRIKNSSYNADSLQTVFSSTKSVTAIVFASLVDRGLLRYDDRVVDYWPEFNLDGGKHKSRMRICDVLRHESGLVYFDETVMYEDMLTENIKKNSIGSIIERQAPQFPPEKYGTTREYHSLTRGWVLNEIFRRVEPTGRTVGEYLRDEISCKFGFDLFIGTEDPELGRVQDLRRWKVGKVARESVRPSVLGGRVDPSVMDMYKLARRLRRKKKESSANRPPPTEDLDKVKANEFIPMFNQEIVRRGEVPSGNGHCSARGMAKLGLCILNEGVVGKDTNISYVVREAQNMITIVESVDGSGEKRLLSKSTVEALHGNPIKRLDYGSDLYNEFTQGGVNYFRPYDDDGPREKREKRGRIGFHGWMGFGGSVFQWHRELGISFAYAPTLVCWYDLQNQRGGRLQQAVVECVLEMRRLKEMIEL